MRAFIIAAIACTTIFCAAVSAETDSLNHQEFGTASVNEDCEKLCKAVDDAKKKVKKIEAELKKAKQDQTAAKNAYDQAAEDVQTANDNLTAACDNLARAEAMTPPDPNAVQQAEAAKDSAEEIVVEASTAATLLGDMLSAANRKVEIIEKRLKRARKKLAAAEQAKRDAGCSNS